MESLNEFNVEEARSNLFQKVSQKKTTSSESKSGISIFFWLIC